MFVKVLSRIEELFAIREEWNDLLSRSDQHEIVFLTCEWITTWWQYFGADNEMKIFTVRDANGVLVAISPLMINNEKRNLININRLNATFNSHSYIYDFIVSKDLSTLAPVYEALLSYLGKEKWHLLELPGIIESSKPVNALISVAKKEKLKIYLSERYYGLPYNPINGTFELYSKQLSKKSLKRLNRFERRLKDIGVVSFEVIENATISDSILNEAYNIEHQSWKGKAGSAILCHDNLKGFYTDFGKKAASNDWLRLYFLKVNDERIAFEYNIQYEGVEHCLKIGYKETYAKYSPGNILEKYILEYLYGKKLKRFEILGSLESYNEQWHASGRAMRFVSIYNKSLFSFILYFIEHGFKIYIKRLVSIFKLKDL